MTLHSVHSKYKLRCAIEANRGFIVGELFKQIRAYVSMPTNDGPRTLVVNTINNLVTSVDFLIQLSSSIFVEFKKFEEGVTINQAVLSARLKILKELEMYFQQSVQKSTRPSDKLDKQSRLNEGTLVDVSQSFDCGNDDEDRIKFTSKYNWKAQSLRGIDSLKDTG